MFFKKKSSEEEKLFNHQMNVARDKGSYSFCLENIIQDNPYSRKTRPLYLHVSTNPNAGRDVLSRIYRSASQHNDEELLLNLARHKNTTSDMLVLIRKDVEKIYGEFDGKWLVTEGKIRDKNGGMAVSCRIPMFEQQEVTVRWIKDAIEDSSKETPYRRDSETRIRTLSEDLAEQYKAMHNKVRQVWIRGKIISAIANHPNSTNELKSTLPPGYVSFLRTPEVNSGVDETESF